jgi:4-alpha-glucanotransferase
VQKQEAWQSWPREIVLRKPQALRDARSALSEQVDRQRFMQFIFFRQLDALRAYALRRHVRLLGDMPIFVSPASADVWANAELFLLDRRTRRPTAVAGVPPDYFSKTGQRWGNPLYDWNAMARDGYRWWIDRCRATLRQADIVRMDHFRGFVASWHVPARAKTARSGRWVPGPGARLFDALRKALGGLPFLAEDLGVITAPVRELRQSLDLPGMAVLQFAFASDGKNPFLPHHQRRNSVVYTGTHDNDTTLGWFRRLNAATRKNVRSYVPDIDGDPAAALMRVAYGSVAHTAIVPLQDVLSLASGARMNVPGRARGNWSWRFREEQFTDAHVHRLAELAAQYDRAR